MSTAPTIAVTVAATRPGPNGDLGRRKNALYAEAVRRHGGEPVLLDASSVPADRPARPGTRLARILFPTNVGGGVVSVNSYHHQGVRRSDLAPGLVASAIGSSAAGDLVEGLETSSGRFVIGLQCHPERTESTPDE